MAAPKKSASVAIIAVVALILSCAFFVGLLYGMMPSDSTYIRKPSQSEDSHEKNFQPGNNDDALKIEVSQSIEERSTRNQIMKDSLLPSGSQSESLHEIANFRGVSNQVKETPPLPVQYIALEQDSSLHLPASLETSIPPIVEAWRAAKLDWHLMLPKHNSKWERFGTPQKEGKLRMLVGKEIQATDYLTRFHESGLAARHGHDHGPLKAYSGCDVFSSGCMIHDKVGCESNQLCAWVEDVSLCVEQSVGNYHSKGEQCHDPKKMVNGRWSSVAASTCQVWVDQPAVILNLDSETQSMFYHWWASWSDVIGMWYGKYSSNRNIHFIIDTINDPMFFQYFGLISNFCWRRKVIDEGVCFCNARAESASQADHLGARSVVQMMQFFGLESVKPPTERVKIGIISRRRKRFILNEYDLVDATRKLGYECELLPLEAMTMYEQMKMLRSIDVLVGIHGSALDNSVFLSKNSVMVQLLPYKVEHRVTFEATCTRAGMKYMEWQLKDPSKAFFHWDLLEQANTEKFRAQSKESILAAGQVAADNRETTMFWINQDIIVPIEEWVPLIKKAVVNSPAAQRIPNIA